ncbi:hypothetical protein I8752_20070 [Nostocaceae cyanobacterium CENA369]|uniref:Uncharacterized protein n=1 Tax=Dendronalium phyllosphericum CENA369 TaxID=1725256 RepID=A0A8J7I6V3_9NOST|nr:hypothetical protein [Dendronalium phyllosphericum]MBH8575268.1 hypothetical protein [Dendronalium phyllosphericum CENA369]
MANKPEQLVVRHFPESLRIRLRVEAMNRRLTMAQLLEAICNEWLERNATTQVTMNEVNTNDEES